MRGRELGMTLVWMVWMAWARPASAEPAAAPPTAPSVPDIVVLNDGSMFRGTISEKTAEHVEILLVSGKLRTFAISEVRFAGPSSNYEAIPPKPDSESGAAPDSKPQKGPDVVPMVTVRAQEARLSLRSMPPEVTFYRRSATAEAILGGGSNTAVARAVGYDEMCTAPCEVAMPAGRHQLALSFDGGTPVNAPSVLVVGGNSTLNARYESHQGTRTVGTVVGLASLIIGPIIIISAADDPQFSTATLLLGSGVMVGGTIVGVALRAADDEANIEVVPGHPEPTPKTRTLRVSGVF